MSYLNTKLGEFLGIKTIEGPAFGVELEMEGRGFRMSKNPTDWSSADDGSLRGAENIEWVMRKPKKLEQAKADVSALYAALADNNAVITDSMRAGVHVHVNCSDLTIQQFWTFLALYHCLEIPLTDLLGEDRVGNLFCLRLIDAEMQAFVIMENLRKGKMVFQENIRYAASNLCALNRYGSLEFRAMQTPTTAEPVLTWLDLLSSLREASLNYSTPVDVVTAFSADGEETVIRRVFGDHAHMLLNQAGIDAKVRKSIRTAQNWIYSHNWETI